MSTGDALPATALVISVIALVIALGQILQQYFATAEGFRRYRKDVIGSWSKLTQAPFDLRNLRYETQFVSPHISLTRPANFYQSRSGSKDGDDELLPVGHSRLPKPTVENGPLPSARVSWLALLEHIGSYQLGIYHNALGPIIDTRSDNQAAEKGQGRSLGLDEYFDHLKRENRTALTLPTISKTLVSWDFMP